MERNYCCELWAVNIFARIWIVTRSTLLLEQFPFLQMTPKWRGLAITLNLRQKTNTNNRIYSQTPHTSCQVQWWRSDELCLFCSHMTWVHYNHWVKNKLGPQLSDHLFEGLHFGRDLVMQQGNDPKHTRKSMKECLKKEKHSSFHNQLQRLLSSLFPVPSTEFSLSNWHWTCYPNRWLQSKLPSPSSYCKHWIT